MRNASLRRSRGRLRFGIKRHEGTPCQREQIRAQNRKDDNLDNLSHDQPGHTNQYVGGRQHDEDDGAGARKRPLLQKWKAKHQEDEAASQLDERMNVPT